MSPSHFYNETFKDAAINLFALGLISGQLVSESDTLFWSFVSCSRRTNEHAIISEMRDGTKG